MKKYIVRNKKGEAVYTFTTSDNDPLIIEEELDLSVDLSKNKDKIYSTYLCVRSISMSDLYQKAFYLSSDFNWELKKDSLNDLCLVPTKKSQT